MVNVAYICPTNQLKPFKMKTTEKIQSQLSVIEMAKIDQECFNISDEQYAYDMQAEMDNENN